MRIRTSGEYEHRMGFIEGAADYYDCNKTQAILNACDDVPSLVAAARAVLDRDDLTMEQKREIAEEFSDAHGVEFEIEESLVVEKG